jgi:hypothetical protein
MITPRAISIILLGPKVADVTITLMVTYRHTEMGAHRLGVILGGTCEHAALQNNYISR